MDLCLVINGCQNHVGNGFCIFVVVVLGGRGPFHKVAEETATLGNVLALVRLALVNEAFPEIGRLVSLMLILHLTRVVVLRLFHVHHEFGAKERLAIFGLDRFFAQVG